MVRSGWREFLGTVEISWPISRFRFPRAVLLDLYAELGPVLHRSTRRNRAIPVHTGADQSGVSGDRPVQRELADRYVFDMINKRMLHFLSKAPFGYDIISG